MDTHFNLNVHLDYIFKKVMLKLLLLRKLDLSKEVLRMVYTSPVESIISYNITCCYGILGYRRKSKLREIVTTAGRFYRSPRDSWWNCAPYKPGGKQH